VYIVYIYIPCRLLKYTRNQYGRSENTDGNFRNDRESLHNIGVQLRTHNGRVDVYHGTNTRKARGGEQDPKLCGRDCGSRETGNVCDERSDLRVYLAVWYNNTEEKWSDCVNGNGATVNFRWKSWYPTRRPAWSSAKPGRTSNSWKKIADVSCRYRKRLKTPLSKNGASPYQVLKLSARFPRSLYTRSVRATRVHGRIAS